MVETDGCFYIVQPVPDDAPQIVKLGHTLNLAQRLKTFRNLCPMARYVKTWPCPGRYEYAAIAYIASDCSPLGGEVFRCTNLPALLARAETFFSLEGATLDDLAANMKGTGRNSRHRTQPEVLELIAQWEQGEFAPTGKRNKRLRQWLRNRSKEFRAPKE